jgi:hypothetical protein
MRYMLLIYGDEAAPSGSGPAGAPGERPEIAPEWLAYTGWLEERRWYVGGERLAPTSSATTVRVRNGSRLVTDGPFAETKEVLGGYYILDCPDLDAALLAAARCPAAAGGSIEVRPLISMEPPPVDESAELV